MRCCRRPNARAAATTAAARMPRPWPTGQPRSIAARRAAQPGSMRSRALLGRDPLPLDPACGTEADPARRLDRPGRLHRLRPLSAGMPGRCHHWRAALSAHGARTRLHRLRAVHRQLPGRLHRDAAARRPASRRRRRPRTARATTDTARVCGAAPSSARRCWPSASAQRTGRHRAALAMRPAAGPSDLRAPARRQSRAQSELQLSLAVRAAGRGDPVGAGDRQERQPGDPGSCSAARARRRRC